MNTCYRRSSRRPLWLLTACIAALLLQIHTHAAYAMGDRELKFLMIDQLETSPDVLLLGSSRMLKYDPVDVEAITGSSAFNAAVSSGRPAQSWSYVTHLRSRFPDGPFPHVVWGLDVEQLRPEASDPPPPITPIPSISAGHPATRRTTWIADGGSTFTSLGFRARDYHDRAIEKGIPLAQRVHDLIVDYRNRIYAPGAFPHLSAYQKAYIFHTIQYANDWGDVPTILLTPMHDTARRALGHRGFNPRRRKLLAWLDGQRAAGLRFELADLTARSSFGGRSADFTDGVHLKPANSRRVLRELDRRGLLRPRQN